MPTHNLKNEMDVSVLGVKKKKATGKAGEKDVQRARRKSKGWMHSARPAATARRGEVCGRDYGMLGNT